MRVHCDTVHNVLLYYFMCEKGLIMQVRASWKHSLKLCTWANIKIFTFLTLKATYDALRVLMVPWFLIPLCVLVIMSLIPEVPGSIGVRSLLCSKAITIFACIMFILAARPSIELKNFAYFKKSMMRGIWMLLFFGTITIVIVCLGLLWTQFFYSWSRGGTVLYLLGIVITLIACLLSVIFVGFFKYFAILFYLDRTESVWIAFKRAFMMGWYNMPVVILYWFVYSLLLLCISMVMALILSVLFGTPCLISVLINQVASLVFDLIFICLATNLYIKLVHEQYELYFPEDTHNG
jgi:hypothetical protein